MSIEEDRIAYEKAAHAMQTGVAFLMERGDNATSPKHLRVGVNSAMVEHAALVRLLIGKGVITDEEYTHSLRLEMEAEAAHYQAMVQRCLREQGNNPDTNVELH